MLKVINQGVDVSRDVKSIENPSYVNGFIVVNKTDGSHFYSKYSDIEISVIHEPPAKLLSTGSLRAPLQQSDEQVLAPAAVKYYTGDKPLEAGMWFRTKGTFGNMMAELVTEREALVLDKDGLIEAYSLEGIKPAHTPEEVERDHRLKEQRYNSAGWLYSNTSVSMELCEEVVDALQKNNMLREV